MRSPSQQSFEIYTHPARTDAPLVIAADRFSFFAFLLQGFWLIYHGAWRVGLVWMLASSILTLLVMKLGISENALLVIQLCMQVWLGLEASSMRGFDARLRGYRLANVIVAHDAQEAEYFLYQEMLAGSAT